MLRLERFVLDKDTSNQVNRKSTNENALCVIADDDVKNGATETLWFYVRTYKDIHSDGAQNDPTMPYGKYAVILAPANDLLSRLTTEEQKDIYKCYYESKAHLKNMNNTNRLDILNNIGSIWRNVVQKLHLDQKAVDYVRTSTLPIPESSRKATDKAHHKQEITFYYEDYVHAIAISIIIKLLIPLLGDTIARCYQNVINTVKETYAAIILHEVFEGSPVLQSTYEKLRQYVFHTVEKAEKDKFNSSRRNNMTNAYMQDQTEFSYTLHGYSLERMCFYLFSQVVVKKLATINYYISNGNEKSDLMKYLHTSIKNSHDSLVMSLSQKTSTSENTLAVRSDSDLDMGDGKESDDTHLEQSSRISNQPADRSMFINYTATLAVEKHLVRNDMPLQDHRDACVFYERNLQHASPLANALVASYVGYCVGGPKGIRYLTLKNYIPLLAATQLMLALRDFTDIVHLITATSHPKTTPFTSIESSLQQNYRVSNEYNQCLTLFPYALGKNKDKSRKIGIEKQIENIINWITENEHLHKTAPSIQKHLTQHPAPEHNTLIQYQERVAANICGLILDHHQEE